MYRLPPVMPPSEADPATRVASIPLQSSVPGRLASHPDSPAELPQPLPELVEPENPDRPPDARDGAFQKLIFTGDWLAPGGSDGLGISSLEVKTVLGLPIPSRRSPLVITPGFAVHYMDGPTSPDLPPRLYEAYAQFRWWKRFSPQFGMDFAVTLGVFSDFEQGTDEAIRTPAHIAAVYEWTPECKFILGAAYLDRDDVDFLPIGGVVWNPNDDFKFELAFPRPKIARRIYWCGACGDDVKDWLYVAGEFGGGTWAIRRDDGSDDRVTYGDYRVLLGLERWDLYGLDGRLEVGYVFGREISYLSPTPDFHPTGTVLLRAGVTY
jgi:hypothetical protein